MNKTKILTIAIFTIIAISYLFTIVIEMSYDIRKLDNQERTIFNYNNKTIKMKCNLYCDFSNLPCYERHKDYKILNIIYDNVLYKNDEIYCNLHYYGFENQNVSESEIDLWFYKEYVGNLKENILNLTSDFEQFIFSLDQDGLYNFKLTWLPSNEIGWNIIPIDTTIYAYNTKDDYDSIIINLSKDIIIFSITVIGIIITFILGTDEIKINNKNYRIYVYKKKKKK